MQHLSVNSSRSEGRQVENKWKSENSFLQRSSWCWGKDRYWHRVTNIHRKWFIDHFENREWVENGAGCYLEMEMPTSRSKWKLWYHIWFYCSSVCFPGWQQLRNLNMPLSYISIILLVSHLPLSLHDLHYYLLCNGVTWGPLGFLKVMSMDHVPENYETSVENMSFYYSIPNTWFTGPLNQHFDMVSRCF